MRMNEADLRATLRLTLAEGVGAAMFDRLVEAFGDVRAAAAAGKAGWQRVEGIGPKKAEALAAVDDARIDAELAAVEAAGARILTRAAPDYPVALQAIHDPPAVLYVRGELAEADAMSLAVVGSRRCTAYGMAQAERFGRLFAQAGFSVVSGGARGIDTAAHRGCLAAGGRTLVVMGCGLASPYPRENGPLFDRIVAEGRGAILSELPMATAVLAGNFPTRNRIISGLSLGVLVVEAARRSGSLITARTADEQGRAIFALPGPVDSPTSRGANELIREGVTLVQDLEDVLEQLGEVGRELSDSPAEKGDSLPPLPPGLGEAERRIVELIGADAMGLDEIAARLEMPVARTASTMTLLVLKGAIRQKPGMVFSRK
jgi:DNA processing protein